MIKVINFASPCLNFMNVSKYVDGHTKKSFFKLFPLNA